jgi:hypothetical protein
MLALRGLCEGFARGLVPLHTPPLLGRKPSSAKSRVSITSKLIETEGLQVPYFGHLRKTGGRGSYRLVHTADPPRRNLTELSPFIPEHLPRVPLSPLFPLHTKSSPVTLLFPLLTQKQGSTPPSKNVGAPTFSIFPHIFCSFCGPRRTRETGGIFPSNFQAGEMPSRTSGSYLRSRVLEGLTRKRESASPRFWRKASEL